MAAVECTKPMWTPSAPEDVRTTQFMRKVNAKYGLSLSNYGELWAWSTENIGKFWGLVWDDTGIIGQRGTHVRLDRVCRPDEFS